MMLKLTKKTPLKRNRFSACFHYLLNYISGVFERTQTQKSQFINAMGALVCFFQLIILIILKQVNLSEEHAFHPIMQTYGITYLTSSLCLYIFVMYAGRWVHHAPDRTKDIYCFLSLYIYSMGAVFITYAIGSLSIATGVSLMMTPLVGLILFRHQLIITTAICVLPVSITIFILVTLNKIPYSLLITNTASMHKNITLLAFTYGAGTPFLVTGLFIAYACIERWKQREQAVRTLSTTDALTLLANRSEFLKRIDDYLSRPRMHRKAISLIMMDLDNFKHINDSYGHLIGDKVLKNIAQTLTETVRDSDLVARYGGEEFCVFLPDTHQDTAETIAKRLLSSVKDTLIRRDDDVIHVTVSIGVTTADTHQLNSTDININMLLAAIDQGMYESKQKGKNTSTFKPLPIGVL